MIYPRVSGILRSRLSIAVEDALYALARKTTRASQPTLRAYWYRPRWNFGDFLTPALLGSYGISVEYSPPDRADALVVGSVLEHAAHDYSGAIIGSGLIRDVTYPMPRARIVAVRGRLTAERIGAPADIALGDPGLLAGRLLPSVPAVRWAVGIVPHWFDRSHPAIADLKAIAGRETRMIDVRRSPSVVLAEIASCEMIVSSSLHGIIVAHAFGIPAAWIQFSDGVIGDGFKFMDHATAVGWKARRMDGTAKPNLTDLREAAGSPPPYAEEAAIRLHAAFEQFSAELLGA